MPGRPKLPRTPRTVGALLLAFAVIVLLGTIADRLLYHGPGSAALPILLLVATVLGMGLSSSLLVVPRRAAVLFLAMGLYVLVAALVALAIIPSAPASAPSEVPTRLSILIAAALFLVAGAMELLEMRRDPSGRAGT